MKLEVSTKRQPKPRSTEASFEKRFAKALEKLGLMSYHTAERFYQGIPDRYVAGGNWIEFKTIPYSGKRSITPQRYFKPAQKLWLSRFHRAGDRVFACILFQPAAGDPRVLLCPWSVLEAHGSMSIHEIELFTTVIDRENSLVALVERWFRKDRDRHSFYTMDFKP